MNTDQPLLLGYRAESSADRPLAAPGWMWPVLSTVPGLFCWLLFASAAMPHDLPVLERVSALFGGAGATGAVLLVAWAAAVTTSLAALLYFGRRPQLWHTTVCLGLHLAGLLFSVLLLGGLLISAIA